MKKIFSAFLFVFLATGLFAADSIKLKKPENGALVSPLTTLQRLVAFAPEANRRAIWDDRIFMQRVNQAPGADLPEGEELRWEYTGAMEKPVFHVLIADNEAFENARSFDYEATSIRFYNLFPGLTCYWKVLALDEKRTVVAESSVYSFTCEAGVPRVLYVPGGSNFRDLGGLYAAGDLMIPCGMLYRSSAIAVPQHEDAFGIATELDLRWKNETNGQTASVWGENAKYLNIPAKLYGAMFTSSGMANYAELFRVFTKAENYPIHFHCVVGADRTGTLAFLLEAVLGVSEEGIRVDYLFSSFSSPRYFNAIDALIRGMDAFAVNADDCLQCKAERYLLKAGVTAEEIRAFQKLVLGDDVPISPVLDTWLKIDAMKAAFTREVKVEFPETSPLSGKMLQCGKEFVFQTPERVNDPLVFAGSNDAGAVLFQLRNDANAISYGAFRGASLKEDAYVMLDPVAKIAYLAPNGTTNWTKKELSVATFPLEPLCETTIVLQPASVAIPEGFTQKPIVIQDNSFIVAPSDKAAPVIDGKLDDEMWTSQKSYPLCTIDGTPAVSNRVGVTMGTNPEHDILYFAVKLEDNTFVGSQRERDRECWSDDEIEIFISAVGSSTYYQLIFNRVGSILDGIGQNTAWTIEGMEYKCAECDGGWVLEASIPLAQLNLPNAIEINLCTTDVPGNIQRNLGATGGVYHNREALRPILLK